MSIPLMKQIDQESPYQGWTHAVYVKLAYHCNDTTGLCCPSEELLAAELKISTRTVRRCISILIADGAISRTKRGTKYTGSSHYEVNRPTCPVVSGVNRTEVMSQPDKYVSQPDRLASNIKERKELKEIAEIDISQERHSPTSGDSMEDIRADTQRLQEQLFQRFCTYWRSDVGPLSADEETRIRRLAIKKLTGVNFRDIENFLIDVETWRDPVELAEVF